MGRGRDKSRQGFEARLEAAKRASSAQLLMRCGRLVNERGVARAAKELGVQLRTSHTSLFAHIDLDGTRQTEIARRAGISKQAVNQLVAELEALGMLERVADPSDGRATLVRFTSQGRRSLLKGLELLGEIEDEMRQAVGEARLRALHEILLRLDDWLTREPTDRES